MVFVLFLPNLNLKPTFCSEFRFGLTITSKTPRKFSFLEITLRSFWLKTKSRVSTCLSEIINDVKKYAEIFNLFY